MAIDPISPVTLVIGGTGTLGRSVIELLSQTRKPLVFSYFNNAETASQLCTQHGCNSLYLDLKETQSFEPFIHRVEADHGPIANLIFSSGYPFNDQMSDFFTVKEDIWDSSHKVDVRGPYFLTQSVALQMKERSYGRIVFIGSVNAIKSLPSPSLYTAHKSAVAGMVRSLARELGKYNILINSVDPGILTDGMSNTISDQLKEDYKKFNCLNLLGEPLEIAKVIQWLISEKNSYLIGQSFVLDGGL